MKICRFHHQDHILQLPNEMLTEILSYIPDQLTVGLTCSKFYEISCETKFYALEIGSRYIGNSTFFTKSLDDDEIFRSIMNSKRRIQKMKINKEHLFSHKWLKLHIGRLTEVIEHFGSDIKELELSFLKLSLKAFSLLNLMPNVQKVKLFCVFFNEAVPDDFNLKLSKLTTLDIQICPKEVLEVFNNLPVDVLRKLTLGVIFYFHDTSQKSTRKYFGNQRKIKEMISCPRSANFVNLQMKLTSLELKSEEIKVSGVINGQDELTSLKVKGVYNSVSKDFTFVCNELKSLELLEFDVDNVPWTEFQEIAKLRKLKKASFKCYSQNIVGCLSHIRSESLQELEVDCYKTPLNDAVIELSLNCKNLRTFTLRSLSPPIIINTILLLFPKLKSLSFEICPIDPVYAFPNGFQHFNLTKLQIGNYISLSRRSLQITQNFLELVSSCKNLESFSTSLEFDENSLTELFQALPKLNSLCLRQHGEVNEEIISTCHDHGMIMESFYCFDGVSHEMKFGSLPKAKNLGEETKNLVLKKEKNRNFWIVKNDKILNRCFECQKVFYMLRSYLSKSYLDLWSY